LLQNGEKSKESLNFLEDYSQFNKRNSGFIQVNTSIFYLHQSKVIDDKELIFLCRVLGDCNARNTNVVRISHSRVMKFASCGKEKANKIIKRMVNKLKFLTLVSLNKRSGYLYRLDLEALETALKLNYNLFVERSSESSINEVVNYDNRTGDVRLSGSEKFESRTQRYINDLIKDYYSYIRYLTPQAKTHMASEFWRLENKGFDRKAIKFFIEFNKVNLEKVQSIYALIASHGKEYFESLELIKQSFEVKKPESVNQSHLVAESVTKEQKPLTEEEMKEVEEAKKFLAEFIKS
tara:strand:+ start:21568 stop:22446 length:879 start_codon:yes stop_codon:yes gene_type:complete